MMSSTPCYDVIRIGLTVIHQSLAEVWLEEW